MKKILVLAVCASYLMGCPAPQGGDAVTPTEQTKYPCDAPWTEDPYLYEEGSDGVLMYTGFVSGVANKGAGKVAAEQRARAGIAAAIKTQVAQLVKDYQESLVDLTDEEKSSEIQAIEIAQKSMVDMAVSGVIIVKTCTDRVNGNPKDHYALAALDPTKFAKLMDDSAKAAKLSERAQEKIRKKAEQGFMDLDAEREKAKAAE